MAQARSQSTRDKVVQATTALIIERGHQDVSLQDIVTKSGVSNGSIFHHFGSKDGILETIFVEERTAYLGYVGNVILAHKGDACESVGSGAKAAIDYQARDPNRHYRLVGQFSGSKWMSEHRSVWRELAAELERPVVQWAMPLFASGELPMLPPAAIQSMILGTAELLCDQWRMGRLSGDLESYGPIVAEYVTVGLKHLRDKPDEVLKQSA